MVVLEHQTGFIPALLPEGCMATMQDAIEAFGGDGLLCIVPGCACPVSAEGCPVHGWVESDDDTDEW